MGWKRIRPTIASCRLGSALAATFVLMAWLPAKAEQPESAPPVPPVPSEPEAMPQPPTPTPDLEPQDPPTIAGRQPGYWQSPAPAYRGRSRQYPGYRPGGYYGWQFEGAPGFERLRYRPYWYRRWGLYRGYGRGPYRNPWLPWR